MAAKNGICSYNPDTMVVTRGSPDLKSGETAQTYNKRAMVEMKKLEQQKLIEERLKQVQTLRILMNRIGHRIKELELRILQNKKKKLEQSMYLLDEEIKETESTDVSRFTKKIAYCDLKNMLGTHEDVLAYCALCEEVCRQYSIYYGLGRYQRPPIPEELIKYLEKDIKRRKEDS